MTAWKAYGMTPSTAGAPLGHFVAADFKPGDRAEVVVCTEGEGHRLVVGPPGSGKFTSVIAPLLLTTDQASTVVFDVKNGEAAQRTARHRNTLGNVAILDPFGVSGFKSATLNPLDLLRPGAPDLLETATRLADAIFVRSGHGGGNADYFDDQASDVLAALLIHIATSPSEPVRTLTRLREIIRRPFTAELLDAMEVNQEAGGVVADTALNFAAAAEADAAKNTFYVQQTLRANTRFLDLPSVQQSTARTTVNLRGLRSRVSSLYVVVPEYQLGAVGRWLRLIYSVIMEEVRLGGLAAGRVPLHVVLDEFPALGRFSRVSADMALVRSYGIHMHVVVQSLAQLDDLYGKGWRTFVASAKWQQILGANDDFTADFVSKRLGTTTKPTSSSSSTHSTGGGSQGQSRGWQSAPLMAPHEVSQLDSARCLVLVEGQDPLNLRKWIYYQSPYLKGRATA